MTGIWSVFLIWIESVPLKVSDKLQASQPSRDISMVCWWDQTLRGRQTTRPKVGDRKESYATLCLHHPSWFLLSSICSHYDWRFDREALAGDEVMVQGIDYTSVSPIFSVLLQFGFVSVVYSKQCTVVNVLVRILLVNEVESWLLHKRHIYVV